MFAEAASARHLGVLPPTSFLMNRKECGMLVAA